jgi:hypothetical protein
MMLSCLQKNFVCLAPRPSEIQRTNCSGVVPVEQLLKGVPNLRATHHKKIVPLIPRDFPRAPSQSCRSLFLPSLVNVNSIVPRFPPVTKTRKFFSKAVSTSRFFEIRLRGQMTVEDQILMTQVHSGHTQALGVLFERYFRLVLDKRVADCDPFDKRGLLFFSEKRTCLM